MNGNGYRAPRGKVTATMLAAWSLFIIPHHAVNHELIKQGIKDNIHTEPAPDMVAGEIKDNIQLDGPPIPTATAPVGVPSLLAAHRIIKVYTTLAQLLAKPMPKLAIHKKSVPKPASKPSLSVSGMPVQENANVVQDGGGYMPLYLSASAEYGVPVNLLIAQDLQESGLNPQAQHTDTNGSVDRGIAQINSAANPQVTPSEAFDPAFAIPWQARHLRRLYNMYGSWVNALSAYNSGKPLNQVPSNYYSQVHAYVYSILQISHMPA